MIQLWVNCGSKKCGDISAMAFGIAYFIEGILLMIKWNSKRIIIALYLLIIILNTVGCFLGFLRLMDFLIDQNIINGFILWHLIADVLIVPLSAYSLCKLVIRSNVDDSTFLNKEYSTQNGIEHTE